MTRTRVIAALVLAPAVIGAILLLPTQWLMLLSAAAFMVALWEWLRIAGVDDTLSRSVLLACNLAVMVALVWASRAGSAVGLPLFRLVIVLGVAWWLLALIWLRRFSFGSDNSALSRSAKLAAGTAAVLPAWCALAVLHHEPRGPYWLLLAMLLVWAADTGAYFAGRRFGGRWFGSRRLAPRISPNKTIEGLLGGVALALVVAVAGALLLGTGAAQLPAVLLVSGLTVLFSVAGDLFESLLKRHAGVKDSGTLIPGHGGVLDRIDSLLAALPVFALGKLWLGF